jgi:3-oxoacyl-[acyl-carrier-protein] synthase III
VVTTAQIACAFPGWPAEKIEEKTGIVERRCLWPLDVESGRFVSPRSDPPPVAMTGTDMGEIALRRALRAAELPAAAIDVLVVVTCTPDQPRFSHDAMALQRRLGLRGDAHCFVVDSGCGGSLYVVDMLARALASGSFRAAAIVGVNVSSSLLDREVYSLDGYAGDEGESVRPYLTAYVFGDGAGALVICREAGSSFGIASSLAGNEHWELVRSPGGGTVSPAYGERYRPVDHTYIVNGRLVLTTYLKTMRRCIVAVAEHARRSLGTIARFYLHQPNARALRLLSQSMGLHEQQIASNVARVGNTSSAGMFILLAEDLESKRVTLGSGLPVIFAAVGAGVHYGAQLVYL